MRFLVPAILVLALTGCGGSNGNEQQTNSANTNANAVTVGDCLGNEGYLLQPGGQALSASTPRGVAFVVSFYRNPAFANAAATASARSTAVENAVVTPGTKGSLSKAELGVIKDCIEKS